MRRLIMWNLMTLDGCFEGPQAWDLEFHQYAWGEDRCLLLRYRPAAVAADAG